MSTEKINPPELVEPAGYAHVVVATGTRRVYVAGQTGIGSDGAGVEAMFAGVGEVFGDDMPSAATTLYSG